MAVPPQLSSDELAQVKAYILVIKRKELVDNIDPTRHLSFLRSELVLDERDCDEIKSARSRSRHASAEMFLDILARKGHLGYDAFCNALLDDRTQIFLLRSMTQTLEILKSKVIEDKGSW